MPVNTDIPKPDPNSPDIPWIYRKKICRVIDWVGFILGVLSTLAVAGFVAVLLYFYFVEKAHIIRVPPALVIGHSSSELFGGLLGASVLLGLVALTSWTYKVLRNPVPAVAAGDFALAKTPDIKLDNNLIVIGGIRVGYKSIFGCSFDTLRFKNEIEPLLVSAYRMSAIERFRWFWEFRRWQTIVFLFYAVGAFFPDIIKHFG